MKKKLFFAALAAVVLSLGFTSCSKDDDDASVYEETYNVRFQNNDDNSAEYAMITEAFRKGLNITDTLKNTVVVQGKDKADCDTIFKNMVSKVNDGLYTKTYEDTTVVLGFRRQGEERLFEISYEPVTNDYWIYDDNTVKSYVYGMSYSHPSNKTLEANKFICFMGPFDTSIGDRWLQMIADLGYLRGTIAYFDANEGAYALDNRFYLQVRNVQTNLLTDAIAIEDNNGDVPHQLTLNGHTYTRTEDAVSLNYRYGGTVQAPQVYIYSTTDDIDGTAIFATSIHRFYSRMYVVPHYQGTFWFFKTFKTSAYTKEGYFKNLTGMDETGYNDCKKRIEEQGLIFHQLQRYNYNKTTQQLELVGPCCLNEGIGGLNTYLCWGTKSVK